jgi:hypothetical protein
MTPLQPRLVRGFLYANSQGSCPPQAPYSGYGGSLDPSRSRSATPRMAPSLIDDAWKKMPRLLNTHEHGRDEMSALRNFNHG